MPIPRKAQIDLNLTPFYHVINRCVRRAYLCGEDQSSGKNFDYRRAWLLDRVKFLASKFTIDIVCYAVMDNHYHLILHVKKDLPKDFSMNEVLSRWLSVYGGNLLAKSYLRGDELSESEMVTLCETAEIWRKRLFDISWFMKSLNENISKTANKEDECTGSFWEGRFKSQALLGMEAILRTMVYIDLNPIRAKIVDTLEGSDFTSIQERIKAYKNSKKQNNITSQPSDLLKFSNNIESDQIPFELEDYIELLSYSARDLVSGNIDFFEKTPPKLLTSLNISQNMWNLVIRNFTHNFGYFIGSEYDLHKLAILHNVRWHKGCG